MKKAKKAKKVKKVKKKKTLKAIKTIEKYCRVVSCRTCAFQDEDDGCIFMSLPPNCWGGKELCKFIGEFVGDTGIEQSKL